MDHMSRVCALTSVDPLRTDSLNPRSLIEPRLRLLQGLKVSKSPLQKTQYMDYSLYDIQDSMQTFTLFTRKLYLTRYFQRKSRHHKKCFSSHRVLTCGRLIVFVFTLTCFYIYSHLLLIHQEGAISRSSSHPSNIRKQHDLLTYMQVSGGDERSDGRKQDQSRGENERRQGRRQGDKIISVRRERGKPKFSFTVREGEAEDGRIDDNRSRKCSG